MPGTPDMHGPILAKPVDGFKVNVDVSNWDRGWRQGWYMKQSSVRSESKVVRRMI